MVECEPEAKIFGPRGKVDTEKAKAWVSLKKKGIIQPSMSDIDIGSAVDVYVYRKI